MPTSFRACRSSRGTAARRKFSLAREFMHSCLGMVPAVVGHVSVAGNHIEEPMRPAVSPIESERTVGGALDVGVFVDEHRSVECGHCVTEAVEPQAERRAAAAVGY